MESAAAPFKGLEELERPKTGSMKAVKRGDGTVEAHVYVSPLAVGPRRSRHARDTGGDL